MRETDRETERRKTCEKEKKQGGERIRETHRKRQEEERRDRRGQVEEPGQKDGQGAGTDTQTEAGRGSQEQTDRELRDLQAFLGDWGSSSAEEQASWDLGGVPGGRCCRLLSPAESLQASGPQPPSSKPTLSHWS